MPHYAQLYEEAFRRLRELVCEEWRVYCYVFFHSYPDSKTGVRICKLAIEELCEIYDLDPSNTARRLKRLRTGKFSKSEKTKNVAPMESPWLFKTRGNHLIPLVGLRETVNITVLQRYGTVKITDFNCKNYSKTGSKTVNFTVPLKEGLKNLLNNPHTNEKTGVGVFENSNGNKSIFSLDECIRYAEKCKSEGEDIKSPRALGKSLFESGEFDSIIQNTLYPQISEEISPEAKSSEKNTDCPRCYGSGLEYIFGENGEDLGCRPNCQHKPLVPGEWLYKWRAENADA